MNFQISLTHSSAVIETNVQNLNMESNVASVIEEKIVQIQNEFRSTIGTVDEALKIATKNYDKKCRDFDFLNEQLKTERVKNKELKRQLDLSNIKIKNQDDIILKLQQNVNNHEQNKPNVDEQLRKELAEVKGVLFEMIAYEKYVIALEEQEKKILTLSNILIDNKIAQEEENKNSNEPTQNNQQIDMQEIDELLAKLKTHIKDSQPITTTVKDSDLERIGKKSSLLDPMNPNAIKNAIKLYNFTCRVKAECEKSALMLQSMAKLNERKSDCSPMKTSVANDDLSKSCELTPQDVLRRQSDKIKSLKSQVNLEKERAEKVFVRNKSKFEKEMNEEKSYRSKVKHKLEHIIRKNRAVIEELNNSREK